MKIIKSNDSDYIKLLQEYRYVMIKYHTTKDCAVCRELLPVFERLSQQTEYEEIAFVRMDSQNNPVALKFVNERKLPFVAIFQNGLLIECKSVTSEQDLLNLLDQLLTTELNL